jgi:multicomponent Na+:H+ antiporter subunit F
MNGMHLAFYMTLPLLSLALALAFVRLIRGPSLPDRVVALDLMAVIGIGFIADYSVAMNQRIFLDVAVVMALIGFLATVAFAYYVKRGV